MTMHPRLTHFGSLLIASGLLLFAAGCGSQGQKIATEPTVVPTATENLRSSLTDLAKTGEKNTGTELLKDEIEKLRDAPGVDVEALQKDLQEILTSGNRSQVAAKAKQMLEKLPKS